MRSSALALRCAISLTHTKHKYPFGATASSANCGYACGKQPGHLLWLMCTASALTLFTTSGPRTCQVVHGCQHVKMCCDGSGLQQQQQSHARSVSLSTDMTTGIRSPRPFCVALCKISVPITSPSVY